MILPSQKEKKEYYILSNNREKKYFINNKGDKIPFIKKKLKILKIKKFKTPKYYFLLPTMNILFYYLAQIILI